MKWIKLIDMPDSFYLFRGALLKFNTEYPFEKKVIMMVCEDVGNPFRLGLITITGTQAGLNMYTLLPMEASQNGLSSGWLIHNWNEWIYPNSDINEVMIHEGLSAHDL